MRLLHLYQQLQSGEGIQKRQAAERFGVNVRSIQRDIDKLRCFFEQEDPFSEIRYDSKTNRYLLVQTQSPYLSNGELLAVCKILLDSRSLPQKEMEALIKKLLGRCVSQGDSRRVAELIANERLHYIPPRHGQPLLDRLWQLAQAINDKQVLQAQYRTQTGELKQRLLQPVGLMFSEYYFYLVAFIEDIDRQQHFENPDDPFPTIYRVDRLESFAPTGRHFAIPYARRFSEGDFRKRVQFMYGGRLHQVRFLYRGPSLEAVLDRLPTARVLGQRDGAYEITAEVFGKGIDMWLKSQGDWVQVLE